MLPANLIKIFIIGLLNQVSDVCWFKLSCLMSIFCYEWGLVDGVMVAVQSCGYAAHTARDRA